MVPSWSIRTGCGTGPGAGPTFGEAPCVVLAAGLTRMAFSWSTPSIDPATWTGIVAPPSRTTPIAWTTVACWIAAATWALDTP